MDLKELASYTPKTNVGASLRAGLPIKPAAGQLHGPCLQWSTSVDGKTVSRRLGDEERTLCLEWVENRKRLEAVIQEMHDLALDAVASAKNNASRR